MVPAFLDSMRWVSTRLATNWRNCAVCRSVWQQVSTRLEQFGVVRYFLRRNSSQLTIEYDYILVDVISFGDQFHPVSSGSLQSQSLRPIWRQYRLIPTRKMHLNAVAFRNFSDCWPLLILKATLGCNPRFYYPSSFLYRFGLYGLTTSIRSITAVVFIKFV